MIITEETRDFIRRFGSYAAFAGILLVAICMRFAYLQNADFFYDTALFSDGVVRMIEHSDYLNAQNYYFRDNPSTKSYSAGPIFYYLLTPMFMVSKNPLFADFCIGIINVMMLVIFFLLAKKIFGGWTALAASLLFAVSIWAVIFSNIVYPYAFLPFFTTLFLFSMLKVCLWRKSKYIAMAMASLAVIVELSTIGLLMIPSFILLLLVVRPRMNVKYAIAGMLLSSAILAPHLYWDYRHNFHDIRNIVAFSASGSGNSSLMSSKMTWQNVVNFTQKQLSIGSAGEMNYHLGYALADFNKQLPVWVFWGLKAEFMLLSLSLIYVSIYSAIFLFRGVVQWLTKNKGDETEASRDKGISRLVPTLIIYSIILSFMLASTPNNRLVLPRYYIFFTPISYLIAGILAGDFLNFLDYAKKKHLPPSLSPVTPILKALALMSILFIAVSNVAFFIPYSRFLMNYDYPNGWLTPEPGLPYVFNEDAARLMKQDSEARGCKTFTFSDSFNYVNEIHITSIPALKYTAFRVLNITAKSSPSSKSNMHYFVFLGRTPPQVSNIPHWRAGPYAIYPKYEVNKSAAETCT